MCEDVAIVTRLRDLSDADLVGRVLSGSPDACHALVRRFERPILSVIARMVQDPALAEDLAQETFVKAFRHLERFDPERKLSSWLFKIAHNTTLDHLRRRALVTVSLDGSAHGEDDRERPGDRRAELATPESIAPDRIAERAEMLSGLDAALAKLKPGYREVLLLRFREGLSYQEIADITGQPINTIKVHLHRARHLLAERLEELGFAAPERFGGRG